MRSEKMAARENQLLQTLRTAGSLTTEDAVRLVGVSESTVRRLFIDLEKKGVAVKTYGGIRIVQGAASEYSYDRLETVRVEVKQRIAFHAASLIESGDVVYLDTGTTAAQLAVALAQRIRAGELKDVRLFTNSLVNLNILSQVSLVSLIGGEYRANRRDFHGYLAEETLKRLHFTRNFFGADAFDLSYGFSASDFSSARMNELILQNSDARCAILDSSKFGCRSVVAFAKLSDVSTVVTDDELDPETAARIRESGKELVLV